MATPADPAIRVYCEFPVNGNVYRSVSTVLKSKWDDQSFRKKLKKKMTEDLVMSILLEQEPRFRLSFQTDPGDITPDPV